MFFFPVLRIVRLSSIRNILEFKSHSILSNKLLKCLGFVDLSELFSYLAAHPIFFRAEAKAVKIDFSFVWAAFNNLEFRKLRKDFYKKSIIMFQSRNFIEKVFL